MARAGILPHADESTIEGMASWGINAIRLPMNGGCWLGIHGVSPRFAGEAYQEGFVNFVELLLGHGFVVVLDLHWRNSTGGLATKQDPFLSTDSRKFWASVASHPALYNRPGVIFELFNEPFDNPNEKLSGSCFLDGKNRPGKYVGYNEAVQAIRKQANASNLI
jgi:aryl-phospho-beta-D-glucosidase BglC (GH1 family)